MVGPHVQYEMQSRRFREAQSCAVPVMEEPHVIVLVTFRRQVLRDIMLALLYCAACRMAEVAEMQRSSCSTSPGVLTSACNDGLDRYLGYRTFLLNTLDIYSNLFGRSVLFLLGSLYVYGKRERELSHFQPERLF